MEDRSKYAIINISDYKGGELSEVSGKYTEEELYRNLVDMVLEDIDGKENKFINVDKTGISVNRKYLKEYLDEETFPTYAGYKYNCYYVLDLDDLDYYCASEWIDDTLLDLVSKEILKNNE